AGVQAIAKCHRAPEVGAEIGAISRRLTNTCWNVSENKPGWVQQGEEETTQPSALNWKRGRPRAATSYSRVICQSTSCTAFGRLCGPVPVGNIVPGAFTHVFAKQTKHQLRSRGL